MKNITSLLFKSLAFACLAVFFSCQEDEEEEVVEVVESLPKSGEESGHAYVDLGLPSGTKWAQYSIDAYSVVYNSRGFVEYDTTYVDGVAHKQFRRKYAAEYHGRYFAWGEVSGSKAKNIKDSELDEKIGDRDVMAPYDASWTGDTNELYLELVKAKGEKTEYLWDYYMWGGASNKVVKYNFREECGPQDGRDQLESCDDAAVKNWGGKWRMPTKEDVDELIKNCYWVYYYNYNGTKRIGYVCFRAKNDADKGVVVGRGKVKSPEYTLNDPHIFFRFSGFKRDQGDVNLGLEGSVWSSTLNQVISTAAHCLYMDETRVMVNNCDRFTGRPIRPVFK
ncbi:MAG: hypothetical protein J5663_12210 [Bacteroidaceae bacterium]|nr:hypothetical protein [Bacteroidaceae bacterium]